MMAQATGDLSRGPVLLAFCLATASFALATTFVRFYTRAGIRGGFGADDYTSGAATVLALVATILGILEGTASSGTRALEFNVIGQPWTLISVTLSKISICLFFMGLLRRARQWRVLLAALVMLMAVLNLAFALLVYLQCRPLEKVWDPSVTGTCLDSSIQTNFGYVQGTFAIFTWVFLALFPLLVTRDLARSGEPAWPFYATSALSFISGIFVIVRTAQISDTIGASTYSLAFFTASLMANLEQNLSLISSNLLTLGPLFTPSSTTTTGTRSTTASRSSSNRHRRRRHGSSSTRTTSTTGSSIRKPRRDPLASTTSTSSSTSTRSKASRSHRSKRSNASFSLSGGGTIGIGKTVAIATAAATTVRIPSRSESTRTLVRSESRATVSPSRASSRAAGEHVDIARDQNGEMDGQNSVVGNFARDVPADDVDGGVDGREDRHVGGSTSRQNEPVGEMGGDEDRNGDEEADEEGSEGYTSSGEGDYDEEDEYSSGGEEYDGDDIDLEAWPRGIIKTVSVEVVEEVNEEYVAAAAAAAANGEGTASSNTTVAARGSRRAGRNSVIVAPGRARVRRVGSEGVDRVSGGSGIEQDWETMLRAGPPG